MKKGLMAQNKLFSNHFKDLSHSTNREGWFQEKNCAHFQLSCSWSITYLAKGQLILECAFGVFKSSKKTNKKNSRTSDLASKMRSNQKSSVRESK